jgi:hypothetical protein
MRAGAGPFLLVFNPKYDLAIARRDFSDLCELAFIAGDVLVVADEMQDVMLPNWSPAGWALLLRKGRKRGVRIIGASQRPAGIEKNIWSMATLIRSGRLNYMDDAQAVARVLMVDPYEIIALRPLHWLQRDISEPFILRGHIEFRGGQPVNVVDRKINLPAPRAP